MTADECIASTRKFLPLYDALSITPPIFVTLPPILGKEGTKKLSKRDGAKDILDYRNEGFLPDAMLNFLAFLGWNPGNDDKEIFTKEELIQSFDISRIHKAGAMFNEEKLLWINKEHIRLQSKEIQLKNVKVYMAKYDDVMLDRLLPTVVDRISNYGELSSVESSEFRFFIEAPQLVVSKLLWKDAPKEEAKENLLAVRDILSEADFSSADTIKSSVMPYAHIHGKGNVLWPLRVALSGQEKSVDPFTICFVLGKEEALKRIDNACLVLAALSATASPTT